MPNPPTFNKVNPADTPILTLAITSDNLPLDRVNDFADSILAPKLSEVTGRHGYDSRQSKASHSYAGQPGGSFGARSKPGGCSRSDRPGKCQRAQREFDGKQQAFTLGSNDQILKAGDFKPIIIAYRNGGPVRLQDFATVDDGVENDRLAAWIAIRNENYQPAILLDVQRQPGANIIETVERVKISCPD